MKSKRIQLARGTLVDIIAAYLHSVNGTVPYRAEILDITIGDTSKELVDLQIHTREEGKIINFGSQLDEG